MSPGLPHFPGFWTSCYCGDSCRVVQGDRREDFLSHLCFHFNEAWVTSPCCQLSHLFSGSGSAFKVGIPW